ncbi:MAG: hypothetical protein K0M39_08750 [Rhizobium sp.]|nr:hypothetical protein [Rhizobium sp.]
MARELINPFEVLIYRASVNDSGEARIAATLCLTIFEQFHATLCLIDNGFATHAPGPIRSMLEGLADLVNLTNQPAYLNQLHYENAAENIKLFREYAALPGQENEVTQKLEYWKQQAEQVKHELAEKVNKGLKTRDKLDKAGLIEQYVTYRVLCGFIHPNMTSLIARHADVQPILRYRDAAAPEVITMLLDITVELLGHAVQTLPRFTDLTVDDIETAVADAKQQWELAAE